MAYVDRAVVSVLAVAAVWWPAFAPAQEAESGLMSRSIRALRGEVQGRYDEALVATRDPAIVGANDPRYIWASEAKAQCGIALGYLKSSTRDPVSISKCDDAFSRMRIIPVPPAPMPPRITAAPPAACVLAAPFTVYFDWNRSDLNPPAANVLDNAVPSLSGCNPASIQIIGHTDTSGSDGYNQRLSEQRVEAVRAYLASRGIVVPISADAVGESRPRVPTPDGVREAQNRRVEISVQ